MTEPQRNDRAYPKNTGQDDILDRFRFHPATETTGPKHDEVRLKHEKMASFILQAVPAGRHQSLALTALQESMMWCNAAIACDTKPDPT
jgi:hypothetical protein